MFSKKHYQILAKLLREAENFDDFRENLINYLKSERCEFDETRFRKVSNLSSFWREN